jgi:hypothetical protein
MMYSQIIKLDSTGPAFGDTPQINNFAGAAKGIKLLVRKTEGEIEVGDDILITTAIENDEQDPSGTFYLNSFDFISMDLASDITNFSLACVNCDLEIEDVTIIDNRSFEIEFSGFTYLTFPLITPDDVPAIDAVDPVIVITSDTAFVSESVVEDLDNWTITAGTVTAGHLIIQADQECYTAGVRALSIDLDTALETYATETTPTGEFTLTVAKECVLGATTDLEMTYTMGGAASTVSFADTGLAGTLDIYIYNEEAFYHADEVTVDEDANYLCVSNADLKANYKYSFAYTSTIENDTANYFLKAIYE